MSITRVIALALIASCYAFAVSVYTLDEQLALTNQTVLRFRIENNSSDTLNGVELRYRVVQNTSGIAEPDAYYLPGGLVNWVIEDSVNATLIVYFPNVILYPGDVLGGDAGFAIGLYNKDWSTWTKSDDPSQPVSNNFTLANNVDVLSGGKSLMLDAGKYAGCPIVQFVEIKSDSLSLQVIQQLNTDASSIVVKNKNGQAITANLNQSTIDSMGQKIWRGAMLTQDTAELRGELRVECKGHILAFFAFGWEPTGAADAVKNSLWESAKAFVKADFDMGFNQGLGDGQRLALMKDSSGRYLDARRIENWKFYRMWEEPGERPIPIVWSPLLMQYGENDIDSLTMEWSPLEDVSWYHLVVLRDSLIADSVVIVDTALSLYTSQTTTKIPVLPPGNYVWYADPIEYYAPLDSQYSRGTIRKGRGLLDILLPAVTRPFWGIEEDISKEGDAVEGFSTPFGIIEIYKSENIIYEIVNEVKKDMTWLKETYKEEYIYKANISDKCFGTDAFCAMKDTRMLAEQWGDGFNEENWHKVFPKKDLKGDVNHAVSNRCWLTMAQMFNHYYGGNIASDEILYYVRGGFRETSGGGPVETIQAVSYALNQPVWPVEVLRLFQKNFLLDGSLPSVEGWHLGSPLPAVIVGTLTAGKIMGVSQLNAGISGTHSMVLNGLRISDKGKVYIHVMNAHNMGENEWRYYCDISSIVDIDYFVFQLVANSGVKIVELLDTTKKFSKNVFFSYYIPPDNAEGRLANESIFNDSDNDSVVDFDEGMRFGTDSLNTDSDGDGIDDFHEIEDFMKCYSRNEYAALRRCYSEVGGTLMDIYDFNECFSRPYFVDDSDVDMDGLNVARDADSDGDGFCDNQEIGCARFDARQYPVGAFPYCKNTDVALLAREKLSLNDRSYCKSFDGAYCSIASYGTDFNGSYGINLGVDVNIGDVYSAKSVVLRDRAIVHGNLETASAIITQSSTAKIVGVVIDNSANAELYESIYAPVLDRNATSMDFTVQRYNVYNPGEVVFSNVLGFGANHTAFIFNSGSELVFNQAVNLFASSLKFQKGAKLNAPTEKSVTFHIGKDFQWNGEIVANDMVTAASHIMVYYYGSNTVFVQTNFAGTIIAPNAEVVIGQTGKEFYGAIFAKSIIVHQETKVTWVPFYNPKSKAAIACVDGPNYLNYIVSF